MLRFAAALLALLTAWQVTALSTSPASSVESSGPLPGHADLRSAFARSIGVARSRVRLGAQTRAGGVPVRLWIVRGWTSSDLCAAIQVARAEVAAACGGELAEGSIGIVVGPRAVDRHSHGLRTEVVGGVAAPAAALVRLQLAGRSALRVPARAGAWVAAISRPRADGSRIRRIEILDAGGRVIARQDG